MNIGLLASSITIFLVVFLYFNIILILVKEISKIRIPLDLTEIKDHRWAKIKADSSVTADSGKGNKGSEISTQ